MKSEYDFSKMKGRKNPYIKKWKFLLENQWDIDKDWIAVELFGFNLQKDYKVFVIFGVAFIWEK